MTYYNQTIPEAKPAKEKKYKYIKVGVPAQEPAEKRSFLQKINAYIDREERSENRLKWVGISMVLQSIIITPIVGLIILRTGNSSVLWALACAAIYLTFIPTLSGLSVKILLKTFITSLLVNVAIALTAAGMAVFS